MTLGTFLFPHWAALHVNSVKCREFCFCCFENTLWCGMWDNRNRDPMSCASVLVSLSVGVMLNYKLLVPSPFSLSISTTTEIGTCSKLAGFQDLHWNNCQMISVHSTYKKSVYKVQTQLQRQDSVPRCLWPGTVNAQWLLSQSHHVKLHSTNSIVTLQIGPVWLLSSKGEMKSEKGKLKNANQWKLIDSMFPQSADTPDGICSLVYCASLEAGEEVRHEAQFRILGTASRVWKVQGRTDWGRKCGNTKKYALLVEGQRGINGIQSSAQKLRALEPPRTWNKSTDFKRISLTREPVKRTDCLGLQVLLSPISLGGYLCQRLRKPLKCGW